MQSGYGEKGVNRAWNLINRDSGLGLVRCVTKVAAQQRLGLLPDGRSGACPPDRHRSSTLRAHLNG
jgi:hypothetical protein